MSGTLLEGIELWGELKAVQSIDDIIERALHYCDLAVSMGIGAIRSHVDTCDPKLTGVQALLEVRNQVKDYLDLQLVAFPQDGVLRDPAALELPFGLWIWGWILLVVSLILNGRWPMAQNRCGSCASLPQSAV